MIAETIAALKFGDVVVNIFSAHLSAALADKLAERKISRSVHANALKVFAEDLTRIALDDEELRQNPEG